MKRLVILDSVLMAGFARLVSYFQVAKDINMQIFCSGMMLLCFGLLLYEVNKLTDKPAKEK